MFAITVICTGWITLHRHGGSVFQIDLMAHPDRASLLDHLHSHSTDAGSSESAGPPLVNQGVARTQVAGKALSVNSELPDGHGEVDLSTSHVVIMSTHTPYQAPHRIMMR